MDHFKKLLLANKAWVQEKRGIRKDYFERMAEDQSPDYLWIGCSDSRVPAEDITGTEPGELFVHRNIANLVIHTDFNMLSVLQYAVEVLKVKHIIVCGHYGCGGVRNAISNKHLGLINKWLRHMKDVYRIHERELDAIIDRNQMLDRFVEINVIEQVQNLVATSIVQKSWTNRQAPHVHGWVYNLKTGYITDLCLMTQDSHIDEIYKFQFDPEQSGRFSEES